MDQDGRKPKHHECHTIDGSCMLDFEVVSANKPPTIDINFWNGASAEGEVGGHVNEGHIEVSAGGLLPQGVYTLWFITDKGTFPAAPIDAVYTADGYDPNRLVVNKDGILNYYIAPLDFNPFKGIPTPNGLARIRHIAIAYHLDRTTYGRSPGTLNVNVFYQLMAKMKFPRGMEDEK